VISGTPEAVAKCAKSYTGKWLARILSNGNVRSGNG